MIHRRTLITGLVSLLAAPAIVRATNLMPVKQMLNREPEGMWWVLTGRDEQGFPMRESVEIGKDLLAETMKQFNYITSLRQVENLPGASRDIERLSKTWFKGELLIGHLKVGTPFIY